MLPVIPVQDNQWSYLPEINLPGSYSLQPASPDEMVVRDVLLGLQADTPPPDLIIFVVDATNKVTFRPVKVGIAGEKYFEVLSGVKDGERIVGGTYQAIRELKDGTVVREAKQPEQKPGEKKS